MTALTRWLPAVPLLDWGRSYNRDTFTNDAVAALIVTIMLIPQSLAYALLAGLPVLTCEGTTFAGRVASSLMRHHGMPHWVAPDLQTYELLAVAAAGPARAQLQSDRLTLQQYRHEDYSAYFEALKRVHAMGPRQY